MNRTNLTSLESQVLDTIERVYNCKFIRPLKVTKEQVDEDLFGYDVQLFLFEEYRDPFIIYTQATSDEAFLKFIEKDLKENELIRRKQYGLNIYGNND
jgi:hypothetical protein